MVGNLNSFIVKAKKAEVPKKAMEMESEKQGKEKEAKRESIDDILNTMPRAQVNVPRGTDNSDAQDLKRTVKEAKQLAGTLQ